MNWHRGSYRLTDDQEQVDVAAVHALLLRTYWAAGRELETMRVAVQHSFCVTLFHGTRVVGFARAITDYATFAWLADVVVDEAHRTQGLGKWMVDTLIQHPRIQVRSQWLVTQDAHGLYERFGFARTEAMKRSLAAPASSTQDVGVAQPESGTAGGSEFPVGREGLEVIELAASDSWEPARALLREYAASAGAAVCFPSFELELAELAQRYSGAAGRFVLARQHGDWLGCAALSFGDSRESELRRLFVRPTVRGRGVGEQLCRHLIGLARRGGNERIRLHTLAAWEAARRLYHRLGFAEVPSSGEAEEGRVVFMELPLF